MPGPNGELLKAEADDLVAKIETAKSGIETLVGKWGTEIGGFRTELGNIKAEFATLKTSIVTEVTAALKAQQPPPGSPAGGGETTPPAEDNGENLTDEQRQLADEAFKALPPADRAKMDAKTGDKKYRTMFFQRVRATRPAPGSGEPSLWGSQPKADETEANIAKVFDRHARGGRMGPVAEGGPGSIHVPVIDQTKPGMGAPDGGVKSLFPQKQPE